MKWMIGAALLAAVTASAQVDVQRVAEDAIVLDRVAEASKHDLPNDLLKRVVNEDIDILRGKRNDGTFEWASYERFEASRTTTSYSVQPREDKMQTIEMKGAFMYRVIIDIPERRLLVRKNRPVWVERVDLEYVPQGSSSTERQSIDVKAWLQPGEVKPIDLPVVARQLTARVIATADPKGGYGNVDISLVQARIVDKPDSPYASAVASAKAALRALDNNDVKSLRSVAQSMREQLGAAPAGVRQQPQQPPEPAVAVRPAYDTATQLEMQTELQLIEDLLTGNESERREGLDKLHQLIRRVRNK
jgi:hypothetical protein